MTVPERAQQLADATAADRRLLAALDQEITTVERTLADLPDVLADRRRRRDRLAREIEVSQYMLDRAARQFNFTLAPPAAAPHPAPPSAMSRPALSGADPEPPGDTDRNRGIRRSPLLTRPDPSAAPPRDTSPNPSAQEP